MSTKARRAMACLRWLRCTSGIGGNRPKLTFIGWKLAASAPPVIWRKQRAERGGVERRRRDGSAEQLGRGEAAGEQADRGAFDIAFDAGDLPRESAGAAAP